MMQPKVGLPSERMLGQALSGRRDCAVIATKFGYDVDEEAKEVVHFGTVEETADISGPVRQNCEDSPGLRPAYRRANGRNRRDSGQRTYSITMGLRLNLAAVS